MSTDITTCQMIQCGAINDADAVTVQDCIDGGYAGARDCTDPVCSPYIQDMANAGVCPAYVDPTQLAPPIYLPLATNASMPQIVSDAQRSNPQGQVSRGFTPAGLLNPLPQIVNDPSIGLDQMAKPICNTFAAWVSANPLMAVAGLGVLGYLLLKKN